ncbi:MAG: hypothetical protein M3Q93_14660, partial [Gemmatimonadota bacterium]|nr:hypothetical protein [Gemmatimonadota bacterium]
LLHRAVLATARRHPPGVLPAPAAAGAVPASVCRLSGLRATARCPAADEWFAPGTGPGAACDWHGERGTTLPAEYAEWAQQYGVAVPNEARSRDPLAPHAVATSDAGFRILSPRDGDVYRAPSGVESRYATVALRAAGARATGGVRWFVDGRPQADQRWVLERGAHRVRAVGASGEAAEVRVSVE